MAHFLPLSHIFVSLDLQCFFEEPKLVHFLSNK
jgi:hypothetical protein